MPDPLPSSIAAVDALAYADERAALTRLRKTAALSVDDRDRIVARAAGLVRDIRAQAHPGLMEVFLAEYGLSTQEGIALMCLAEALLRVPDAETIDALIEDKIAPSDWGRHLGHSTSPLVNASTWALMLTGRVLEDSEPGLVGTLRGAVKRLGEPLIRTAVARAMKEMGRQFVLGETISAAMERAATMEARGYLYSYDMLGEAARTSPDADRYHLAYSHAITAIAAACRSGPVRDNPGISVKLSALHPRYELAQHARVMNGLVPRLRGLAFLAKSAGMGLNIDAEEADRLALSLAVIEDILREPALEGWDGLGIVVQAYGQRAAPVIDHIHALARAHGRRLMVRLVKGAYWDTEIKRAQVAGLSGFPVFTRKSATDISYIACARKLLGMTDCLYPQFATHNAHTVASVLDMAATMAVAPHAFEFQRLHGMGEALHDILTTTQAVRCRIYAPVGAHRDLLAYLVRRLLENGANSSFVNQIVNDAVAPEEVARDPFAARLAPRPPFPTGAELFTPERRNSRGFDLAHTPTLAEIEAARAPFRDAAWRAAPRLAADSAPEPAAPVRNPADPEDIPGSIATSSASDIGTALSRAQMWAAPRAEREAILNRASVLYEEHFGEIFALVAREAGKTLPDAVSELREAVDFLRYYAAHATEAAPAGRFVCISPWNFPLAIFTGQIAAALAAGNAVLAKPAEQTPLIASRAVELLHEAGVPRHVLQLLPGDGAVGAALTSDPRVDGVAFTGSTETARAIRGAMARNLAPGAPLIAETGGLNAMIVDSTALPEQAVQAVIESAFQSAGQRCSALRCVYVQEDIAENFIEMLKGAMSELAMGDPWLLNTDVGPVIDTDAQKDIADHITRARAAGNLLHTLTAPGSGHFIAPSLIAVPSISAIEREVFGPVLHLATFRADDLDRVITEINATGYGLTFGLQTRIDDRVQHVCERVHAGNIYVNRNQIGAVVGSQPFGGEGLSGTGPKAGGPYYLARFAANPPVASAAPWPGPMSPDAMARRIAAAPPAAGGTSMTLPGPTGESNKLATWPRPPLLCLGPGAEAAAEQAALVRALGATPVEASGRLPPEALTSLEGFSGAVFWGPEEDAREHALALAARPGPILPLITGVPDTAHAFVERHVCVDTTASGGNAALLGGAGDT